MTISAKIIADSISPQGIRLTTMQLRYPRFIHAEFMTHRVFSRNASSSRAVPVKKLIEDIRRDPAMPIHWGKNQAGMQAKEEQNAPVNVGKLLGVSHDYTVSPEDAWILGMEKSIVLAEAFAEASYHKQIVNRLLEPFSHINVVVTATEWANFYALRRHEDAQPEIKALADAMWDAQQASEPKHLMHGEWHVPYYENGTWSPLKGKPTLPDINGLVWERAVAVSVARCARVSYLTHDGRPSTIEEDLALYDRLVGSAPLHASPAEHQATPDTGYWARAVQTPNDRMEHWTWNNSCQHGNIRGWIQYRKTLPGEFVAG